MGEWDSNPISFVNKRGTGGAAPKKKPFFLIFLSDRIAI
jgi:hypothetical protein